MITQVKSGDTIDPALLEGKKTSIAAFPTNQATEVGSVKLSYGDHTQTENHVPYALLGDSGGNYRGDAEFGLGDHSIQIQVFSEKNGRGTLLQSLDLNFTVAEAAPEPTNPVEPENPEADDEPVQDEAPAPDSQGGDGGIPAPQIFTLDQSLSVTKSGGEMVVPNAAGLNLTDGTLVVGFTATDPSGHDQDTIFSRDGAGSESGHLTVFVRKDDLIARFQTDEGSVYLEAENAVEANKAHTLAFTFDGQTASLYLDGALADSAASAGTWANADEDLAIGGNIWGRTTENPGWLRDRFEGEIDRVEIFDEALEATDIAALTASGLLAG